MLTWVAISTISLIFSALFSGTEIAFVTSDRVRAEIDNKRGGLISRVINRSTPIPNSSFRQSW